jgi:murein L,D-transpeptidase YafK
MKRRLPLLLLLLPLFGTGYLSHARPELPAPLASPRIVVHKAQRELRLFSGEREVRKYRIGLGLNPVGPKERLRDYRTPEGSYFVCNKNPRSQFYLSLQINYPNEVDAERGLAGRLITKEQRDRILAAVRRRTIPPSNTPLGGEIFIHGRGSSQDWTWGCIALDDPDVKELYRAVPLGTPVEIRP